MLFPKPPNSIRYVRGSSLSLVTYTHAYKCEIFLQKNIWVLLYKLAQNHQNRQFWRISQNIANFRATTALRICKCFFRSVLTRFHWLKRRQLDISPKKQYGAFTEKICQKKGKKHIFENFQFLFGYFQKIVILFLKNFRKFLRLFF